MTEQVIDVRGKPDKPSTLLDVRFELPRDAVRADDGDGVAQRDRARQDDVHRREAAYPGGAEVAPGYCCAVLPIAPSGVSRHSFAPGDEIRRGLALLD